MRTFFVSVLVVAIGIALIFPHISGIAASGASSRTPSYTTDGTTLPDLKARAWGVFDSETGELLFGQDVDSRQAIASVSKLMTAYVAVNTLALDATTTISRKAVSTEGRAGSLKAGETYTIRELLFPLLLESSNDAAEAIAEHKGRDAFIAAMNVSAGKMHMSNTAYADPSGLSPKNVSSVTDLATLMTHLAREQDYLLSISQLQKYVGERHSWRNVNPVASINTFAGGKHGYTDEAGRTLAALFEEKVSSGDTRTIIIVLLGSDNIKTDVATIRTFLQSHVAYR